MKKLILLIAAIQLSRIGSAQFVTIPDSQFVKWLTANIPAAMNGTQMDTTHSDVTTLQRIDVENDSIYDLAGVQYFSSLITLDCGNGYFTNSPNRLTYLPALPSTLDTLICGNNLLDSLPELPAGLRFLKCYSNRLTDLPALPPTLTYLECHQNLLTRLPSLSTALYYLNCSHNLLDSLPIFPDSLLYLYCSSNAVYSLPVLPAALQYLDCSADSLSQLPVLPSSLRYLNCSVNQISAFPVLPDTLFQLDCSSNLIIHLPILPSMLNWLACTQNQLVSLPALPNTLNHLDCSNNFINVLPSLPNFLNDLYCASNQLSALPAFPNSLFRLNCYNNQITTLPALPGSLHYLYCGYNQLANLPSFPNSLLHLDCHDNNISCFPLFPNSVVCLNIYNNPANCLPNYTTHMDSATLSIPLCFPGNSNGCSPAEGIVGFTYSDNNGNCLKNAGDGGLRNIPVQLYDNSNNFLGMIHSAVTGVYHFSQPAGTYTVSIDTVGMPFTATCSNPGLDSVITTTLLDTVDFALACKPGFDIGVQSVTNMCGLVFPGLNHQLNTVAGDMTKWFNLNCAAGIGGQVTITVTGNVNYIGPAPGALTPSVAGNVYTYSIADFALVNNSNDFNLIFQTKTTAQAGDLICATVSVTPASGDYYPSNNSYTHCYPVVNSHDPNAKEVYPEYVLGGYKDWFTYTIHFQNTGDAPAINIRIEDTLDNNLDLTTFQVLNYSHPNTVVLNGNLLTVSFPNIYLADSTSNADSSMGFVQYRLKPKSNVLIDTKIYNTAYIYFDYNDPIVTNTAVSTYLDLLPTSATESATENEMLIYPNPASEILNITFTPTTQTIQYKILDITGRVISISDEKQINISALKQGMYLLQVDDGDRQFSKRFVKQ